MARPVPCGLWESLLEITPLQSSDNWGALTVVFTRNVLWACQDFRLEF